MINRENKLYCGDCLKVLQKLIDQKIEVDLIYLDPPFNSNAHYSLTYKSNTNNTKAQQLAFNDMWQTSNRQLELLFDEFTTSIEKSNIDKSLKIFLKSWLESLKEGDTETQKLLNYLIYMTQRLILMKSILKDSGSIYYHCDPSASHYIKIIMDGIFGRSNFRNEIIWCYKSGGAGKKDFAKKHDVILRYSKTKDYYFKIQKEKSYLDSGKFGFKETKNLIKEDEKGYYTLVNARDYWNINIIGRSSKERLGYPTQKPRALLDRIIDASCPDDGLVLDPFCGCGTTIDSAINKNKKWIGIDISTFSIDMIKARIKSMLSNYDLEYVQVETWDEYEKLNPYEKQDFLIQALGGMPNSRKSGDKGVDGELTIHTGLDKEGKDLWGKVIFSVKSGKQVNPAMLRELKGAMQGIKDAVIGVLILDKSPSINMEIEAENSKKIKYSIDKKTPPLEFPMLQIYTASQILDGIRLNAPPSIMAIKNYRKAQMEINYKKA